MSAISRAIQQDRLEQNISQGLLARMMGVSQQVLSRWESGLALPRGHRADELIRILGPESHTAKIIEKLREIEPRSMDGPSMGIEGNRNQLLAQALRGSELPPKSPQGPTREEALAEALRMIRPVPRSPLMQFSTAQDLQMQFAKATDQLARVTSLMGRVANQMTEATELLARLQPAIEKLREEESSRQQTEPKTD
jgi:transcriptional regulator with XRE-family HTH domain